MLGNILISAAKRSFPQKKNFKKRKRKQKGKSWFNDECKKHQKSLRNASNLLSKSPFDKNLRKKYVERRASYRKICRKTEKENRKKLTKQLLELGLNDPNMFWKIICKMNNWGKNKGDPADGIAPEIWKKHFEDLLNGENSDRNAHEGVIRATF